MHGDFKDRSASVFYLLEVGLLLTICVQFYALVVLENFLLLWVAKQEAGVELRVRFLNVLWEHV